MGRLNIAVCAVAVIAVGILLAGMSNANVEDYARVPFSPLNPAIQHATILFGGDMMFERSIRVAMEKKGGDYVFSCIRDVLQSADLVVANLEGPITSHASKSVGSKVGGGGNYTFTFPTSTADLLFRHNIRIVNLGNNPLASR